MRMDTMLTSSSGSEGKPHNLLQPLSGTAFYISFCFVKKHTPIAWRNTCYLMGESGEATNGKTWPRCPLSGNQLVWAAFHSLFKQKMWTPRFS